MFNSYMPRNDDGNYQYNVEKLREKHRASKKTKAVWNMFNLGMPEREFPKHNRAEVMTSQGYFMKSAQALYLENTGQVVSATNYQMLPVQDDGKIGFYENIIDVDK